MKEGRTEDETKDGEGEAGGEERPACSEQGFCFSKLISLNSCTAQLRTHLNRTSDFSIHKGLFKG